MELVKYAILVFAVGATMFSRRWALAVFAFFLPLTQWLPDTHVPGINALNLMLLPLLVRGVAAGSPPASERGEPLLAPWIVMIVLWTVSWAVVANASGLPDAFVNGGGLYDNFMTYKEFLVDVAIYFCARRLTRDDGALRRLVLGLTAGLMFEGLTSSREFIVGRPWRATAHLGQPNKLGDFLAAYTMIPLAWVLDRTSGWFVAGTLGVAFSVLGLLGAVSRGALLSVSAAALACAVLRKSVWVIVVAAAIGSSPLWLPQKVLDRFESTVVEGPAGDVELDTEQEGRFGLWAASKGMITDHPVTGVGLGMFPFHLRDYGYTGRKLKTSHDIYIQLAAEQGLPCSLAHIVLMLTVVGIAWRVATRYRGGFAGAFGLGMFGASVAFVVSTAFGDGFYENNLSGGFWLGAGALVTLWKRNASAPDAAAARVAP